MTNASTTISRLLFNLMDGRFALLVLQFTQVCTPISHPFFANYPFAISRFAFRGLLITKAHGFPTTMTNVSTTISRLLFNLMDGRFALLVLQFTQVRTPISHPFFANYPFAISRFAFRRLLITVFRGLRNSTPRRGIYVNAAEFRGAAETAPFAPDCRQIALTRVL